MDKSVIPMIDHCTEAWKPPKQNIYHYSSAEKARKGLYFARPVAQVELKVVSCNECGDWHHAVKSG